MSRSISLHPAIERLALLGWRLHPTSCRTRAACFADAATLATSDPDQLARWSCQYPGCGWRVVMEGSGIWALDIDVPGSRHSHDGVSALRELVVAHGPLPPRPTTRSGGGGLALFFSYRGEPIIGRSGHPALGIDPRRGRQSLTIPPSSHPDTGLPYRWVVAPWDLAPPPAPCLAARPCCASAGAPAPRTTTAVCRCRRSPPTLRPGGAAARRRPHRDRAAGAAQRHLERRDVQPDAVRRGGRAGCHGSRYRDGLCCPASGLPSLEIKATLTSALAAGLRQ